VALRRISNSNVLSLLATQRRPRAELLLQQCGQRLSVKLRAEALEDAGTIEHLLASGVDKLADPLDPPAQREARGENRAGTGPAM